VEEDWEKGRDKRVDSWRSFMKGGKRVKYRMPKLTQEDDSKTYIKRVKTSNSASGNENENEKY